MSIEPPASFSPPSSDVERCLQTRLDLNDDFDEMGFVLDAIAERAHGTLARNAARLQRELATLQWTSAHTAPQLLELGDRRLALLPPIRALARQVGMAAVADDWQSPMFGGFAPYEPSSRDRRVEEHNFDYKRDRHIVGLAYEQVFLRMFYPPEQLGPGRCYLTNSGMAAMLTAMHYVAHYGRPGAPILVGKGSYHENKTLLEGMFGGRIILVDELDAALIESLTLSLCPAAIFVDAIGNSATLPVPDLPKLLALNAALGDEAPWLVLDMTCLPLGLLEYAERASVARLRRTIAVESLIKYHQYGLDATNAGVLVAYGAKEELWYLRAHLGAAIPDSAVLALPPPDRVRLRKRLFRLQRTAQLLATHIEQRTQRRDLLPRGVHPLRFRGSFFALPAGDTELSTLRALQTRLLNAASDLRCPLVAGTSFGFCITRLYLTAATTRFGRPFLRLAPGTETVLATERLKAALSQALTD